MEEHHAADAAELGHLIRGQVLAIRLPGEDVRHHGRRFAQLGVVMAQQLVADDCEEERSEAAEQRDQGQRVPEGEPEAKAVEEAPHSGVRST
jgi:hypothetical protein